MAQIKDDILLQVHLISPRRTPGRTLLSKILSQMILELTVIFRSRIHLLKWLEFWRFILDVLLTPRRKWKEQDIESEEIRIPPQLWNCYLFNLGQVT